MIWNPGSMDTEVFKFALEQTAVQFVASSRVTGPYFKSVFNG